jgi:EamA domain-containing membrane protein RarD
MPFTLLTQVSLIFARNTHSRSAGVFALHEQFERARTIGFVLIWAALLIYAGEGLWLARKQQRALA